jgi:integrase
LEAVYFALANEPDLQTAWVLGATIGPRTVDLFSLRWGANVQLNASPPEVWYIAKKTGKVHWVPLPPCAVAHLRRLARSQGHLNPDEPEGLVFPRLTAGGSKDPEKSRSARARNDRIKAALLSSGLDANNEASDYYKPIQVLRSTCNSRLNNHDAGKGLLITHGKDADVSSQAYWNERDSIIEAVMSLPQPTAFLSL